MPQSVPPGGPEGAKSPLGGQSGPSTQGKTASPADAKSAAPASAEKTTPPLPSLPSLKVGGLPGGQLPAPPKLALPELHKTGLALPSLPSLPKDSGEDSKENPDPSSAAAKGSQKPASAAAKGRGTAAGPADKKLAAPTAPTAPAAGEPKSADIAADATGRAASTDTTNKPAAKGAQLRVGKRPRLPFPPKLALPKLDAKKTTGDSDSNAGDTAPKPAAARAASAPKPTAAQATSPAPSAAKFNLPTLALPALPEPAADDAADDAIVAALFAAAAGQKRAPRSGESRPATKHWELKIPKLLPEDLCVLQDPEKWTLVLFALTLPLGFRDHTALPRRRRLPILAAWPLGWRPWLFTPSLRQRLGQLPAPPPESDPTDPQKGKGR